MENLPDRLKAWRDRAGLTQDQAARAFFTTTQSYRNWENGRYGPRGMAMGQVDAVIERSEAWGKESGDRH